MSKVTLPETETRVKSITVTADIFSDRVHGLVIKTRAVLPNGTRVTIDRIEAMPLRIQANYWSYLAEDTLLDIEALLGPPWGEAPVMWSEEFVATFKKTVKEALKGVGIE